MGDSYKKKVFTNMATGFGAAIVIVGAMFKIMHWPGASVMLVAGLSTEAALFIMGAFEKPHMEVDWSLVYPELAHSHGDSHEEDSELVESSNDKSHGNQISAPVNNDPISQKLDQMLMDANIGTELIESLGEGLRTFGSTAKTLNEVGSASVATEEFIGSIKGASENVSKLSDSYLKASESLTDLVSTNGDSVSYGEQLSQMTKNLAELNSVYAQQISANNDSVKLSAEISTNINQLLINLSDSVEDTKRYKEQVAILGENLSKLNTVYGNMLSAMTVRG
jgi:gliding motility-associated protein GldL